MAGRGWVPLDNFVGDIFSCRFCSPVPPFSFFSTPIIWLTSTSVLHPRTQAKRAEYSFNFEYHGERVSLATNLEPCLGDGRSVCDPIAMKTGEYQIPTQNTELHEDKNGNQCAPKKFLPSFRSIADNPLVNSRPVHNYPYCTPHKTPSSGRMRNAPRRQRSAMTGSRASDSCFETPLCTTDLSIPLS